MTTRSSFKYTARALMLFALAANAQGAVTDLATTPLNPPASVLPNVMFVLDDSGSMAWDYMPDTVSSFLGKYGYVSSQCNGVYYNPRTTYTPPIKADGSSYSNSSFTAAPIDGYGITTSSTLDLSANFAPGQYTDTTPTTTGGSSAYYYTYSGSQTSAKQKDYYNTSSTFYQECNSAAPTGATATITVQDCSGSSSGGGMMGGGMGMILREKDYKFLARGESGEMLTVDGGEMSMGEGSRQFTMMMSGGGGSCSNNSTSVTYIKVNGLEIMSGSSTSSATATTVATNIAAKINACTSGMSGNCQIAGYRATVSGSTVYLYAPSSLGNITYTPAITFTPNTGASNDMGVSSTALSGGVNGGTPGSSVFTRVGVSSTSGDTAHGMPADERTNFANWYSYYRTRILMMKTASGLAFSPMSTNMRVAFMTINNNVSPDILNWDIFSGTQRSNWYTKLYGATANNSTPLREALSNVGRMYAKKLTSLYSTAITDPIQYSCQKNFTILSTDGYWNGNAGVQLDGSTAIGNQDGSDSSGRPYIDGTTNTSDTLADVAEYYYKNDLRTSALGNTTSSSSGSSLDVSTNDVKSGIGQDADNKQQHMTTFTVGLGTRGSMAYDNSSYWGDTTSDFYAVQNGSTASSASGICTWQSNGTTCNWPVPVSNTYTAVDDLWHAAVNGRGTFFNATDSKDLVSGLGKALDTVGATGGMSAPPTVSNPNVASGDNYLFVTRYNTSTWDGDVKREQIDINTGAITSSGGVPVVDWSAQVLLDTNASRTIYTYSSSAGNKLKSFTWANLSSTGTVASCASGSGEQGCFAKAYISAATPMTGLTGLTQFLCASSSICLSSSDQTTASGSNLVSFLAGTRTNEGGLTDNSKYYRQRAHLLGDLVNASTVYVKASQASYADSGYATFKATNTSRQGMVYAAANDGMLHAFNADTGAEVWAYIPTMVLPKLYTLADKNYSSKHQFFVDATPVVGDVYFGGAWHTILVGGLGGGGKGYYALDVTTPATPKALWEFTNTNVGYAYGTPVITKLCDGSWVVLLTSGYNNADGLGHLYVVNPADGTLFTSPATPKPAGCMSSTPTGDISTGVGSAGTPSGLSRISAKVPNAWTDNTVQQVYGGDMRGNLWRFDVNGTTVGAAGYDAQLLVTLKGPGGTTAQPITTAPAIGNVNGNVVVYVGTGSYLGTSDLTYTDQSTTGKQTMYAIKDALATGTVSATAIYTTNPRSDANFVQQTVADDTCPLNTTICTYGAPVRTNTSVAAVDWSVKNGWWVDFPATGERANTDPQIELGTLGFTTNVPTSSACVDGYSFRWFLNYKTGAPITTSTDPSNAVVAIKSASAMSNGVVNVVLPDGASGSGLTNAAGSTNAATLLCDSNGSCTDNGMLNNPGTTSSPSRTSWRELISE